MPSPGLNKSDELRVYDNILEAVGKTPLVRLNRVGRGSPCPIYAKLEYLNPGGSVKDRIGPTMIAEAEASGRLRAGGTVVNLPPVTPVWAWLLRPPSFLSSEELV